MDKMTFRRVVSMVVAMTMILSVTASAVEAAVATWLAPQPGVKLAARNIEVAVGYNTRSDTKVTRLELWVDGKLHAKKGLARAETRGVCSFWWDTAKYSDGPHDLVVKVYAGDELLSKVSSTGIVGNYMYDLRPPVVSFINVKSGDVLKGVTTLKLSAQDDSGEAPLVSLLVDKKLKLVQNRSPYNYDLDTTTYSDGAHELQTYAYDSAGNKSDSAVVKVSFKNDIEKPVAAQVSMLAVPNPERFDETPPVSALPTISARAASPVMRGSAGRVVSSRWSAEAPSEPVASAPKPASDTTVAPIARVAQNEVPTVSKSASAAKPVLMAKAEPVYKVAPSMEPAKVAVSAVSASPVKVLSVDPVERISAPSASFADGGAPVEPLRLAVTQPSRNLHAAKPASLRCEIAEAAYSGRAQAVEEASAAPAIDPPTASSPKPTRVAVVPFVKDINAQRASNRAYGCPPPVAKDTRARLEKKTISVSGKVKLRDLYNDLRGVLFWDAETRMVTAISGGMKIEFTIGSTLALVNGKKMRISEAPRIVDGRTVIDVGVYHQAKAFLSAGTQVKRS